MGMTLPEAAEYLSGIGFDAHDEHTKIVVYVKKPMWRRRKEKVRNALRAVGYKGRWSWRLR